MNCFVKYSRACSLPVVARSCRQRILVVVLGAELLSLCPSAQSDPRPWRTDHAGVSPYTIEPGHFEAEIDAVRFGYSEQRVDVPVIVGPAFVRIPGQEAVQSWTYGSIVLKAGLLKDLDAEVSVLPWTMITHTLTTKLTVVDQGQPGIPPVIVPGIHDRRTTSGFGDTTVGLKLNLWGNENGKTSLAISGSVKFPTADESLGNGLYEGGPGIEFSAELPLAFELRINTRATLFEPRSGHLQAGFNNLIGVVHPLTKTVEAYCVFDTFVSSDSGTDWSARVRAGLNYRPYQKLEFFAGSDVGVQPQTGSYGPFVGFSVLY